MGLNEQREVECMKDDTEHVDDFWCPMLPKPESVRTCSVACPEDCRVSDWSEWSQCSNDSEEDAIQSRIRVVLQPALHKGSPCPALIEKRSCFDWLAQQDRIRWHLSPWTACQLPPTAKCGSGITVRSNSTRYAFTFIIFRLSIHESQVSLNYPLLTQSGRKSNLFGYK